MEQYLKEHYYDEITLLLNDTNDRTHASLQVEYVSKNVKYIVNLQY